MTVAATQQVLIMAGGTGGHVYPAMAVAETLRARGYNITWLGTSKGLEARVVPAKGFAISFISAVGVRGKGIINLLKAPFLMLRGLVESIQVIRRVNPVVVLGMGGFVTVPGGLASWLLRKPLVIHEQNAVAGTANRLLSRFAVRVLAGFPDALDDAEETGNPVRAEITTLTQKSISTDESPALRLLVLGGSLGAKPINDVLPAMLRQLSASTRLQVRHQTGTTTHDATRALYRDAGLSLDNPDLRVDAYIEDMAAAYEWADLVLCRAGAITLAEIACAGLPAILVPLPHAIDDHQNRNAAHFVDEGAAILMPQAELTAETLAKTIARLASNRRELSAMARETRRLSHPDAALKVADICVEASRGNTRHG